MRSVLILFGCFISYSDNVIESDKDSDDVSDFDQRFLQHFIFRSDFDNDSDDGAETCEMLRWKLVCTSSWLS